MDLGATKTFIMFGALYLWWDAYLVHIWSLVILMHCIYGAYLVGCMSDAMHLWCGDDLVAHCIFGMVILWCIFSALYLWWDTSLVWWVFGMVNPRYAASLVSCTFGVMHLCCDASLAVCIFGELHIWCDASMVCCILVAIFFWRTASSVHCISGVMYMHFWYAMQRHLWWCLVGAIAIVHCAMHLWSIVSWSWVQYIFGVASLVLVSYIAQACYHSGASTLLYLLNKLLLFLY